MIGAKQAILLFTSMISALIWGTLYAFPLYFEDLKQVTNATQAEMDLVGAFHYVGSTVIGIPLGPILLHSPLPLPGVVLIAGFFATFSYLMYYLTSLKIVVGLTSLMCLWGGMAGISTGFYLVILLQVAIFGGSWPPQYTPFLSSGVMLLYATGIRVP